MTYPADQETSNVSTTKNKSCPIKAALEVIAYKLRDFTIAILYECCRENYFQIELNLKVQSVFSWYFLDSYTRSSPALSILNSNPSPVRNLSICFWRNNSLFKPQIKAFKF
jgi:hypothetical protein